MSMNVFVLDASVLVARVVSIEAAYADSSKLFDTLVERESNLLLPAIALPEVSAALSRGTGDTQLGMRAAAELRLLPGLDIIPVETSLSDLAAKIAAIYRIRGCDAIYVALAQALDAILITLDRQQRERVPDNVVTLTPGECLSSLA